MSDYVPASKDAIKARAKSGISTQDIYLDGLLQSHQERATPKRNNSAKAPAYQSAFSDDPYLQRSDIAPVLAATNRDVMGGGEYGLRGWMAKHPVGVQAAMIAIAATGAAASGAAAGGGGGGAAAEGGGAAGWGGAGTANSSLGAFGPGGLATVGGGNAGTLAASGAIAGGSGAVGLGSSAVGLAAKGSSLAQNLRDVIAKTKGGSPAVNPTLGDGTSSNPGANPMLWRTSDKPLRRFQRTPDTIFKNFRATN